MEIYIGTSGWHYKHWKGNFYPARIAHSEMLRWYAQRLRTIEINNCFYRLPTPETVQSWVEQTPADFCFSLKASRYITHNRKLIDPEQTTLKFLEMARGFGKKLGPIVFQLPPSWSMNEERLAGLLKALPTKYKYAFEFRHPSWHTPAIYRALRKFNAALCIFEIAGMQSPLEVTADFVYVRLHGPGKAYQGKYSPGALHRWAERIEEWTSEHRKVFFYFDNDQSGFAAENAVELSQLIGESVPSGGLSL